MQTSLHVGVLQLYALVLCSCVCRYAYPCMPMYKCVCVLVYHLLVCFSVCPVVCTMYMCLSVGPIWLCVCVCVYACVLVCLCTCYTIGVVSLFEEGFTT